MKKGNAVFIAILLGLVLTGCGTKEEETQPTATPAQVENQITETENPAKEETKNKELPLYTIDDESLESVEAIALVPEDAQITAKLIVDEVVKALAEHSVEIGIYSVTEEEDKVYVSFTKDGSPAVNSGSGVEGSILESFAKSLVDNLDKKVIFRIEEGNYESGHIELGIDEVYLWQ